VLDVRPASEFYYEAGKSKLVNLKFEDDDGPQISFIVPGDVVAAENYDDGENVAGRQGQLLRLSGWIDIESRATVSFMFYFYIKILTLIGWLCWCSPLLPPATAC
jgi:DNA mismatch repair protein MSH5